MKWESRKFKKWSGWNRKSEKRTFHNLSSAKVKRKDLVPDCSQTNWSYEFDFITFLTTVEKVDIHSREMWSRNGNFDIFFVELIDWKRAVRYRLPRKLIDWKSGKVWKQWQIATDGIWNSEWFWEIPVTKDQEPMHNFQFVNPRSSPNSAISETVDTSRQSSKPFPFPWLMTP